jgi:hypothetical protein
LLPFVALPDCINYDWVHSALQNGVLNCEVEALLLATAVTRAELQTFLASPQWQFPEFTKQKSRLLHRVFDARRVASEEPDKVKASCSELLGLYGMLRMFFHLKFAEVPAFERHLASFNQLCKCIDWFLALKRGTVPVDAASTDELQACLRSHLEMHTALYGDRFVRPKHHWLLDTPAQFLRDRVILDGFIIERTHLIIKGLADLVKNTVAYERSVLTGVLCHLLQDANVQDSRLLGRTAPLPGSTAVVADRARIHGVEFVVGELALFGDQVGVLKACVGESGELFFLMKILRLTAEIGPCCGLYEQSPGGLVAWRARAAQHPLAWRTRSDGTLFVARR